MRTLFRRRDFRLLFAATATTMVGESVLLLVLAIWVKDLTGSSSLAGLTLFALAAPALLAPVLGWIVDRLRRKPFLVAVTSLTAVVISPLLSVRDRHDVGLVYAVAVLYGASSILASAALNALIKELLPEDLLAEANGVLQTVRQGLRLIGPLSGAGLFTAVGGPAVVAVDMVCLVAGGCLLAAIRIREEPPAPPELRWLGEVAAGVRHLFGPPALRRSTVGVALAVTVLGFIETLGFAYVDLGLHRGPAFLSVLVCVQGVGGIAGGITAARVVRRFGEIGAIAIGMAMFVAGFAGMVFPNLAMAFVAVVGLGWGIPYAAVGFNTLMQRVTPPEVLGRVTTASDALIGAPQALSIAAGAALVAVVDYRILFAAMSIVLAVSAAYLWAGRELSPPLAAATSRVPVEVREKG